MINKQPSRRSVAKTENTRNLEEVEKYYPVLKFSNEPIDEYRGGRHCYSPKNTKTKSNYN